MDEAKNQNPQTIIDHSKKPLFLLKITLLVLSFALFSFFLFSYWPSFSFHSFNFHFSTFYTINDRTCVFILCNGILVFLATNSGLITTSSPSGSDQHNEFFKKNGDDLPPETIKASLLEREIVMESTYTGSLEKVIVEEGSEKEEAPQIILEDEEQETESDLLMKEEREEESVAENEKGEKELESDFFVDEEDEDEEDEELNKKFDDFIKRMKEEIRIEAQQQLIMVK